MNFKALLKIAAGTAVLGFGTAASAVVYCPGNSAYIDIGEGYKNTTTQTAPLVGTNTPAGWFSNVSSNQFADGRECYWVEKNLDSAGKPTYPNGWAEFDANSAQFNLSGAVFKDVVDNGVFNPAIFDWDYDASTGLGSWKITGYDVNNLYIGFHFGNGQDNPDSFIVQLSSLTGDFTFANKDGKGMGLSNLYLFGKSTCTNGNCGGEEVPEPGSLALLGAGLAGLALMRRRRRD